MYFGNLELQACAEKRDCFAKHQPGVAGCGWLQPGRNFSLNLAPFILLNPVEQKIYTPFSLQRWIRSILCDVWVAEKSSILGYQTTEVFFSRHDWNILVEEVNAHQELPVGMATYTAANVSQSIRRSYPVNLIQIYWIS